MSGDACCHIVCAGPGVGLRLSPAPGDFVIAADGGYLHCLRSGVTPDLYVGDSDSLGQERAAKVSCPRLDLPVEKDDTDTRAAALEGCRRGYRRFSFHAALGGDLGHTLANIQVLLGLRKKGAYGVLHGAGQDFYLVFPEDGVVTLQTSAGCRVSVFSWGPHARGVCESGLKWELSDAELSGDFPLGVSNEASGSEARFSVGEGVLAIVVG